jgi:hypothetical protein
MLSNNSCLNAVSSVQPEDLHIYQRWLISHFLSQKSYQQAIKILEWLPLEMSIEKLVKNLDKSSAENSSSSSSFFDDFRSDYGGKKAMEESTTSSPPNNDDSEHKDRNMSGVKRLLLTQTKFLDNIFLSTPNAVVPRDEILNSISFSNIKF